MLNNRGSAVATAIGVVIVTLLAILVFQDYRREAGATFDSQYQAVLLTNGDGYFGKIEKLGSSYPVLKDVYYFQRRVNQKTKEVTNILVKRGNEWHGPDHMILNTEHILFIEPVSPDSRVAELIREVKNN